MLVRFGANAPVRRARRVDNEDDHDKQQRAMENHPVDSIIAKKGHLQNEERTFALIL